MPAFSQRTVTTGTVKRTPCFIPTSLARQLRWRSWRGCRRRKICPTRLWTLRGEYYLVAWIGEPRRDHGDGWDAPPPWTYRHRSSDRSVVPSSPDGGHASCERSVVTAMGSSGLADLGPSEHQRRLLLQKLLPVAEQKVQHQSEHQTLFRAAALAAHRLA